MIKSAESMREETREAMRGGKGAVGLRHLFEEGEYKGHARLMARVTLGPGCSIGQHEHLAEEELYYIIKGRGLVEENGETRMVSPGDAVLTGGGGNHRIENAGQEELEFLAVILTY